MTDRPQRLNPMVRDPKPLMDRLLLGYVEDPPATTRTSFVAALRAVLSMAAEELDVALIDDERLRADPEPGDQPIEVARRVRWFRRGQNAGTITMVNRIVSRIEQALDAPLTGLAAMEAKEAEGGFHLDTDKARRLAELVWECRDARGDLAWARASSSLAEWLTCHTSLGEDRDERG